MLRYKITREDCAGNRFLYRLLTVLCPWRRSLAPAAVVHEKRLKMMVGDEQTDTSVQTRRKSLLTLDQQHSSSDIFVSISGLIGIYEVDFVLLTCDVFTLSPHFPLRSPFILCRCWKDYPSNQTGREDEPSRVL